MSAYTKYDDDGAGANFGSGVYDNHTGDPRLDLEHQRLYNEYKVPEEVRRFILELRDFMADNNVFEMQRLYEERFPLLNQEYFNDQPWPEAEDIAPYLGDDSANSMFIILYKELYYRHLYALPAPNLKPEHRFESYFNYCSLFNLILSTDQPIDLELPNQWLWDIIDEFIYQFQAFTQYRSRLGKKTAQELDLLSDNPTVWNVLNVLNVLHSLVDKSNINQQLAVYSNGGDPDSAAGEFGRHPLYKMLGYFSLIGLLRLHSLLGDYYQAIKVLENIELHKQSMHARVPACQITTFYYVGFAYLMMRRYADAIRTFSNILLYIQRTKQMFQVRGYQSDLMSKQTEQMFTLLAICLVLHPQSIDESVQTVLTDKYHEKMLKMSRGVREEFESAFTFACPKFLSPVAPDLDSASMTSGDWLREPQRQQLRVFMDEVEQQVFIDMVSRFGCVDTATELIALEEAAREASVNADLAVAAHEKALSSSAGADQISAARAAVERTQMAANVASERSVKARAAAGLEANTECSLQVKDVSIPTMRSYLRLYTTLRVDKMADFLGLEERRFRSYLPCFKYKMKNVVWCHGTSGLDGQFQSDSEIDFYIDDDMIHIADTKVAQRYGDFFIRQIHKLEELNHTVSAIKLY